MLSPMRTVLWVGKRGMGTRMFTGRDEETRRPSHHPWGLGPSVGGFLINVVGVVFFHEHHHHAGGRCSHGHAHGPSSPSPTGPGPQPRAT